MERKKNKNHDKKPSKKPKTCKNKVTSIRNSVKKTY